MADARNAAEKAAKKTSSKSKNKRVVGTIVTQEEEADACCEKCTHRHILMKRLTSRLAMTAVKHGGTIIVQAFQ